jgi:hypothetical protein
VPAIAVAKTACPATANIKSSRVPPRDTPIRWGNTANVAEAPRVWDNAGSRLGCLFWEA